MSYHFGTPFGNAISHPQAVGQHFQVKNFLSSEIEMSSTIRHKQEMSKITLFCHHRNIRETTSQLKLDTLPQEFLGNLNSLKQTVI